MNSPARVLHAPELSDGDVAVMRTFSQALAAQVARHHAVWPQIHDDLTPRTWKPDMGAASAWLLVQRREQLAGTVYLHPITNVTWQGHVAMLPGFGGKTALVAMRLALRWMRENTNARTVCAMVPESPAHRQARHMVAALGMRRTGVLPGSFLKDGELLSQALYSINLDG